MDVSVRLSKAEYESVLLDLVNRVMLREVAKEEIKSITVSYTPESDNPMTITLSLPGP